MKTCKQFLSLRVVASFLSSCNVISRVGDRPKKFKPIGLAVIPRRCSVRLVSPMGPDRKFWTKNCSAGKVRRSRTVRAVRASFRQELSIRPHWRDQADAATSGYYGQPDRLKL